MAKKVRDGQEVKAEMVKQEEKKVKKEKRWNVNLEFVLLADGLAKKGRKPEVRTEMVKHGKKEGKRERKPQEETKELMKQEK